MAPTKVLSQQSSEELILCSPVDYPKRSIPFIISSILLIILGFILTFLLYVGDAFPTTYMPFDLKDPAINQPHLPNTLNGMLNVAVTIIMTSAALAYMNFSKRSVLGNKLCLSKTLLQITYMMFGCCVVNLLTNFVKHYYGEPRPHFIEVCQPNQTLVDQMEGTYVDANLSRIICTAVTKNLDYRWAFPSGHSSQAAYTMMLTILALQNTKFPSECVAVQALLQLGAATYCTFVCFSRIADYHHHWWDVLAGALLGAAVAAFVWYGYIKKRAFTAPKEAPKVTDPAPV